MMKPEVHSPFLRALWSGQVFCLASWMCFSTWGHPKPGTPDTPGTGLCTPNETADGLLPDLGLGIHQPGDPAQLDQTWWPSGARLHLDLGSSQGQLTAPVPSSLVSCWHTSSTGCRTGSPTAFTCCRDLFPDILSSFQKKYQITLKNVSEALLVCVPALLKGPQLHRCNLIPE